MLLLTEIERIDVHFSPLTYIKVDFNKIQQPAKGENVPPAHKL